MNNDKEKYHFQMPERNTKSPSSINAAVNPQSPIKRSSPIISYSGRKKRFRFSLRRLIMPLLACFLAFLLLSAYTEKMLGDRFTVLAKSEAEKHLLETVNAAVGEMAKEGLLSYSSMVKTIRDATGEVIYLEVDTAMLAKAKSDLVKKIDASLEEENKITVSVPIGSLGGWNLFSALGFPVKVRVHPIGMAEGEIYTVLEDCGINQTRHLIRVDIRAKLLVVLPDENTEVETEVSLPLGERVLVGDVPEIYLDNIGGN